MVLVPGRIQGMVAASGFSGCVADLVGQAIAKTHRYPLSQAMASCDPRSCLYFDAAARMSGTVRYGGQV